MKLSVAVIFSNILFSAYFFQADGKASLTDVDVFTPQSLFQHYRQVWRSTRLSDADHAKDYPLEGPAPGISYFTPVTEQLIQNGTISRDTILRQYNSITVEQKQELYNKTQKLQQCWRKEHSESKGRPIRTTPACCFFNWDHTCQQIYRTRNIAEGETELKLIECVTQNGPAVLETLKKSFGTNSADPAGIHVEFGVGFAAGLYFAGSGGVAFDVPDLTSVKITSTTCWGIKFDASFGGGISVSFLPDMNDLLGKALTIELGLDLIPGSEFGFDLLIHYSTADSKFVGFGLAFGMGIGLSPVDLATSMCNTKLIAEYQDSVKIKMGYAGPSWHCHLDTFGVVSEEKYICCPARNSAKDCNVHRCWFNGKTCPFTPAEEYNKGTPKSRGRAIAFSSCLGRDFVNIVKTEDQCRSYFRSNADVKHFVWNVKTHECWISKTRSLGTCSWAPTHHVMVGIRPSMISNHTEEFQSTDLQ